MMRRALRWAGWGLAWLVALLCAAWAFGALYYDFPVARQAVAWAFLALLLGCLIFLRSALRRLGAPFAAAALVLAWWLTLNPPRDADWQPDVAQLPWAEIAGDTVTIHNVRHCEYRTESDYTPHWETRTVRLSQLTGADIAINYWGSPWMAHPILSFQFADTPPLCFSIETRKRVGQSYSAIGGLYRQFTLIYLAADERDAIRVRTNFRRGEDVYLYRLTLSPERVRARFLEYVHSLNALHANPRWYHALTTNCTTTIRAQHPAGERIAWDWRLLANGKGDELMFERGFIATDGLAFPALKSRALINSAAQAADRAPDFSHRIRAGRPGFGAAPAAHVAADSSR